MDRSTFSTRETPGVTASRRVRHEVRDSIAVMAFSALTSSGIAILLTVMVRYGN